MNRLDKTIRWKSGDHFAGVGEMVEVEVGDE